MYPSLDSFYLLMGVLPDYVYILIGGAVIAGHVWTVFLKFKGGKGVATTAGVMAGLAPLVLVFSLIVWIAVFSIWKYVSLASIVAASALPVFALSSGRSLGFVIFCVIICLVGVHKHKANIKRLLQGTEDKIIKTSKS